MYEPACLTHDNVKRVMNATHLNSLMFQSSTVKSKLYANQVKLPEFPQCKRKKGQIYIGLTAAAFNSLAHRNDRTKNYVSRLLSYDICPFRHR